MRSKSGQGRCLPERTKATKNHEFINFAVRAGHERTDCRTAGGAFNLPSHGRSVGRECATLESLALAAFMNESSLLYGDFGIAGDQPNCARLIPGVKL